MHKKALMTFALLFLFAAGIGYDFLAAPAPNTAPAASAVAAPAPDFTFTDIRGTTHRLSDFNNHYVLLNFWATWCAPCIREIPLLTAIAKAHPDQLVMIMLSVDSNDTQLEPFFEKFANAEDPRTARNAFIGKDPERRIANQKYQTYKYPETYLISPDQRIERKILSLEELQNFRLGEVKE